MQRTVCLLALLALFAAVGPTPAQDTTQDDELNFVRRLRERGDADLALEYLEKRLSKDPRYTASLPLEIAQTRLQMAESEPDAAKRLGLFTQARAGLEAFLGKNPTHPRAADARLQVAQLGVAQARTQLARALSLPEGDPAREEAFRKARELFVSARKGLETTAKGLTDEKAKNAAAVELGRLLVAQAHTYSDELDKGRSQALDEAIRRLEDAASRIDPKEPLHWEALAWAGRAFFMQGELKKAQAKLNEVIHSRDRAALDARRLARYFELRNAHEQRRVGTPEARDILSLISAGQKWLTDYRGHARSAEGLGVHYILARQFYHYGKIATNSALRKERWDRARAHVRVVEASDNEFTARAQQVKIDILVEQKAFTRRIETLGSFDDCYMRALYEHHQLVKNEKNRFDTAEKQKKQRELVRDTLKRALLLAKNRKVPEVDLATAYYLLTGYHHALGEYAEAARVGEEFLTKGPPRARNASVTALLTADALSRSIKEKAGDDFNEMTEERQRLYQLGRLMVDRWPGDKAGVLGRYLVATHLVKRPVTGSTEEERTAERRKREQEALALTGDVARFQIGLERFRQSKFLEALDYFKEIKPDFPSYTLAEYHYALAALQLDENHARLKAGGPPEELNRLEAGLKRHGGGGKGSYRDLAVAALERVPEPSPDADPDLVPFYVRAKVRLGLLLYSARQYDRMEQIGKKLREALKRLEADTVPAAERKALEQQIAAIEVYALYGKSDDAYRAGRHLEVATLLDPLINRLNTFATGLKPGANIAEELRGAFPELTDKRLLIALLGLSFRGNLQADRGTRALEVLELWKKLDTDNPDVVADVLQQTVAVLTRQVNELKKKNDKEKLDKAVAGFKALLDRFGKDPGLKPDMRRLLAQCYMSIGRYSEAGEHLEKLLKTLPRPQPKEDPRRSAPYKVVRVLQVRALRLQGKENKDPRALDKAEQMLNEILADWGKRDMNALKEQILLYTDRAYYGAAVNQANALLKVLLPRLKNGGPAIKSHYFEVYYYFIAAYNKYGLSQKDPGKRDESIQAAATYLHKLASSYPDLGGDESKKRFDDLLASEEGASLKKEYDRLRQLKGSR